MEKRGQRLDTNDCIGYYCKQQRGSGSYFASNYPIQRGYGLFSNLRRYAMPIMMKAGKYLGKHLLSTAQHKTNVSYDDYKENICLYVFDLTQDKSVSEPFGNVTRSGDISIHLKFDAEFPETATLIAYMEMPSLIVEIDKSRNVFIDY
ncbi:uncharacterized protein TNCV_2374031 [Trichonephila clavipes]|nr:uncharacterized protein TNCV_2374031 [Trichonephila clavipes]